MLSITTITTADIQPLLELQAIYSQGYNLKIAELIQQVWEQLGYKVTISSATTTCDVYLIGRKAARDSKLELRVSTRAKPEALESWEYLDPSGDDPDEIATRVGQTALCQWHGASPF